MQTSSVVDSQHAANIERDRLRAYHLQEVLGHGNEHIARTTVRILRVMEFHDHSMIAAMNACNECVPECFVARVDTIIAAMNACEDQENVGYALDLAEDLFAIRQRSPQGVTAPTPKALSEPSPSQQSPAEHPQAATPGAASDQPEEYVSIRPEDIDTSRGITRQFPESEQLHIRVEPT